MVGVMGGAVDPGSEDLRHPKVPVVNTHGPDVDEKEHEEGSILVHWEEEDVEVVGETLEKSIQRMKGMGGKRGRDFPEVVRLVEPLVEEARVEGAVDPINTAICK